LSMEDATRVAVCGDWCGWREEVKLSDVCRRPDEVIRGVGGGSGNDDDDDDENTKLVEFRLGTF